MDHNGDTEPDYALWFNGPNTEELTHWTTFEVDPKTGLGVIGHVTHPGGHYWDNYAGALLLDQVTATHVSFSPLQSQCDVTSTCHRRRLPNKHIL